MYIEPVYKILNFVCLICDESINDQQKSSVNSFKESKLGLAIPAVMSSEISIRVTHLLKVVFLAFIYWSQN